MKESLTLKDVEAVIIEFRERYITKGHAKTVFDINNGLCEDFANDVSKHLKTSRAIDCEVLGYENLTGTVSSGEADYIFYEETLSAFEIPLPNQLTVKLLNNSTLGEGCGGHIFIRIHDMFFDAECPNGVKSPFSLPFAILRLYQDGVLSKDDLKEQHPIGQHLAESM